MRPIFLNVFADRAVNELLAARAFETVPESACRASDFPAEPSCAFWSGRTDIFTFAGAFADAAGTTTAAMTAATARPFHKPFTFSPVPRMTSGDYPQHAKPPAAIYSGVTYAALRPPSTTNVAAFT